MDLYPEDYLQYLGDGEFNAWFDNVFQGNFASGTKLFEAHHIIPFNLIDKMPDLKEFLQYIEDTPGLDFDFNSLENGIMLQKRRRHGDQIVGDHANHPNYDILVADCIKEILIDWTINPENTLSRLRVFISDIQEQIEDQVINNSKIINNMEIDCG